MPLPVITENSMPQWNPAVEDSIECLQIVYKVAERCNINCTYCYYFNMGEETALDRPARATVEVTEKLADWLAHGCSMLRIPRVKISFHGGEPMLLRPEVFDEMCTALYNRIAPIARVSFSIQTNGTLFNDRWLAVFQRNNVAVGVSIDGTREAHDQHRLDHRGQSTFKATETTIKKLISSADGDPSQLPSTISVLDHRVDYRDTYNYLRGLGIQSMGFLLPDRNAEDEEFRASELPAKFGERMFEIFEAWFTEDDPDIQVRFIDETLRNFRVGLPPGPVSKPRKSNQILIARSDGTITVNDSYIPALQWYSTTPIYSITSSSLRDVLSDPIFLKIEDSEHTLPHKCGSCRWRTMCRGGDLENRYSSQNGFDNPSIYCESYKIFYTKVCELLENNGYPADEIERKFGDTTKNI